MTSTHYLQEKCGPESSVFYAVLFAPRPKRATLRAIYVLWRELQEIAEGHHEMALAHTKLEWWRAEVERAATGSPRHPVMQMLAAPIATGAITPAHLHAAIDATEAAIAPPAIASLDDIEGHCDRVPGVFLRLCAHTLGLDARPGKALAFQLAVALELTRIIGTLGADTARRAGLIPREVLARAALQPRDWNGPGTSPALRALLEQLATQAHTRYQRAPEGLSSADCTLARPLLIHAAIERARLAQIAVDGFMVLREQTRLPPLRMLAIGARVRLLRAQSPT